MFFDLFNCYCLGFGGLCAFLGAALVTISLDLVVIGLAALKLLSGVLVLAGDLGNLLVSLAIIGA